MRKFALLLIILASVAAGQGNTDGRITVLTVCEVLRDVNRYADATVAVVGRLHRTVSLIDHHEYLSQDRCEHPIITHRHTWSNTIQIWTDWEEGMPTPPSHMPKLDEAVVAKKLAAVRRTTTLGVHQEPRFQTQDRSISYTHRATVPNDWAVAYGRVVKSPNLDEDCGRDGCGGDDVPLIIIAKEEHVHRLPGGTTQSPK